MIRRYFLRYEIFKKLNTRSDLQLAPEKKSWCVVMTPCDLTNFSWIFWIFFFQFREDVIIGHLHQTLRDQDRPFVGTDPGHVTAVWPPAGHDPGGLTPPLTKIVLHLRSVQELGRLKTGILQSSVNPSIHETKFLTPRDIGVGFKKPGRLIDKQKNIPHTPNNPLGFKCTIP